MSITEKETGLRTCGWCYLPLFEWRTSLKHRAMHLNNPQTTSGQTCQRCTPSRPAVHAANDADVRTPRGSNVSQPIQRSSPPHPNPLQTPRARLSKSDQKLREIGSDFVGGGGKNVTCRHRNLITAREEGDGGGGNSPGGGFNCSSGGRGRGERYLLSSGVYSTLKSQTGDAIYYRVLIAGPNPLPNRTRWIHFLGSDGIKQFFRSFRESIRID